MQFSGYLRYVLTHAFQKLKKKILGMLIRGFAIITHKTQFAIIRALCYTQQNRSILAFAQAWQNRCVWEKSYVKLQTYSNQKRFLKPFTFNWLRFTNQPISEFTFQ